jgi:large subunit ribosomal protein L45
VIAKDVLEYIVFEKHLVNEYGLWRIHDKIIPPWVDNKTPLERTFRKPESLEQLEEQVKAEEMEKYKKLPRVRDPEPRAAISS